MKASKITKNTPAEPTKTPEEVLAESVGAKVPEPTIAPEDESNSTSGTQISAPASSVAPFTTVSPNKKVAKPLPAGFVREGKTKSQQIRELAQMGWSTADIHRSLGLIYQHVRNVLTKPTKGGGRVSVPVMAKSSVDPMAAMKSGNLDLDSILSETSEEQNNNENHAA